MTTSMRHSDRPRPLHLPRVPLRYDITGALLLVFADPLNPWTWNHLLKMDSQRAALGIPSILG